MKKNPSISIIVPVYNVEEYLPRCIDSILAQTFTDFELILVDDGSPDNCGKICDEYAKKDNRIKVIHKENGGVSSARNLGMDNSSGQYITFCDADDCLHKQIYEILFYYAIKESSEIVVCNYKKFTYLEEVKSNVIDYKEREYACLSGKEAYEYISTPEKCQMFGSVCNKLFSANVISNISFDTNLSYGEDLCFVLSVLFSAESVIVLDDMALYYYYTRPNSAMNTLQSKQFYDFYLTKIKIYEYIEKNMGVNVGSYFNRTRILVDTFLGVKDKEYAAVRKEAKKIFFSVIFAKNIAIKEKMLFIKKFFNKG